MTATFTVQVLREAGYRVTLRMEARLAQHEEIALEQDGTDCVQLVDHNGAVVVTAFKPWR